MGCRRSRFADNTHVKACRDDSLDTTLAGLGFQTEEAPPALSRTRKLGIVVGGVLFLSVIAALLAPIPVLAGTTAVNTVSQWWSQIPATIPTLPLPQHSVMLDKNGNKFATFFEQNRVPVDSADIPDNIREAVIATEDQRFYTHKGVDAQGTLRAALAMLRGGQTQGGSGITQQYVKNLLVMTAANEEEAEAATTQTLDRKILEAKTAALIEEQQSKDEILTGYLNTVYFGDNSYGIGAAAKHYFKKKPLELTTPESALLTGIVNNPTAYNPVDHPKAAKERRDHVLGRMLSEGYITDSEYRKYVKTPLTLNLSNTANGCGESKYPFYCSWVRETLANDPVFGNKGQRQLLAYRGGLTIRTPLDPKAMAAAEKTARAALPATSNAATGVAIVQPGTGRVPAIATNRKFGRGPGRTEIIYPITPAFQPGSTFKVFAAAAALEAGFNPQHQMNAPSVYAPPNRNSPPGGFRNSGDGGGGAMNMGGAIRHSVNTWFVMLEHQIGVRRVAETAANMGVTSLPLTGDRAITEKDASLVLGSYETSPLEIANGYATIASGGVKCNPTNIISITNAAGEEITTPPTDCHRVLRKSTARTLANLMTGVIDHPTDTGRTGKGASLGKRPAAGKTGTTDNASAVWFAGFTPQYAGAVWIGDPRGGIQHPLYSLYAFGETYSPVYGGGAPARLWRDTMRGIHDGLPTKRFKRGGGDSLVGIPRTVPNVIGMLPSDAETVLQRAGFHVTISKQPGNTPAGIPVGRVVKQTPNPGSLVNATERDSRATLTIGE